MVIAHKRQLPVVQRTPIAAQLGLCPIETSVAEGCLPVYRSNGIFDVE